MFRILYNIALDNFDGPNAIKMSTMTNNPESSTRPEFSDNVSFFSNC